MIDTFEVNEKEYGNLLTEAMMIDIDGGLSISQLSYLIIDARDNIAFRKIDTNLKLKRFVHKICHNNNVPAQAFIEDINGVVYSTVSFIRCQKRVGVKLCSAVSLPAKLSLDEYRPGLKSAATGRHFIFEGRQLKQQTTFYLRRQTIKIIPRWMRIIKIVSQTFGILYLAAGN